MSTFNAENGIHFNTKYKCFCSRCIIMCFFRCNPLNNVFYILSGSALQCINTFICLNPPNNVSMKTTGQTSGNVIYQKGKSHNSHFNH